MSVRLGLLAAGVERLLDHSFLDHSGANEAHGDAAANHLTVFHDADRLEVLLELPAGNSGGLTTVTTQILGLTALAQAVSKAGLVLAVQLEPLRQFDPLVFLKCAHDIHLHLTGQSGCPVAAGTFLFGAAYNSWRRLVLQLGAASETGSLGRRVSGVRNVLHQSH